VRRWTHPEQRGTRWQQEDRTASWPQRHHLSFGSRPSCFHLPRLQYKRAAAGSGCITHRSHVTEIPCKARDTLLLSKHTVHLNRTVGGHSLQQLKTTNSVAWVRQRNIPTERPAKLVPAYVDRGCRVVSSTDPYGRNLGFLGCSRYYFFQVAPQLYSWRWVDPVPGPLLLRRSRSAESNQDLWICS
jgi:hypothetical protein